MSRTHLSSLTLLLVAMVAAPGEAATQTPSDSTVADSAAPKKAGRCGGLIKMAKAVAGNKDLQNAAKGVACTVVPGAAVVSATTGQGPCANSGLVAGPMGGVKNGAAATIAGGALSGAAQAAAQASAMKMMQSRAKGVQGAASAAAAVQMLQSQGLSSAQAAAVMSGMMQNPSQAGVSATDAAAIMKMMQAMSTSGGSTTAPTGTAVVTSSPAAIPAALWVNYDFVPGARVIYFADFSDDQVGNFPERLQFVEGNMEVAELGGRRVLRSTSASKLTIPLPEVLPQRFTIEIDVINRPSLDGAGFHLRGSVGRVDDAKTSIVGWGSDGVAMLGGGGGEVRLTNNEANRLRYRGKPAQLRILGDGKYVKVYLDEKRLANVPNANFERSKVLHLIIDARSDENPAYVSRIRVAESRKSLYDDLAANGSVATQGLLFDTGSDRLRPESMPTLKQIAAMLTDHPDLRLRIEGHTDNVGAKEANRALSDKRAASVKSALVTQHQVSAARLETKGLGDSKPVGANTTPEGRSNNRRVQLVKL